MRASAPSSSLGWFMKVSSRFSRRVYHPTMRLCRFDDDRLGLVEGDSVRDVTQALDELPRHGYPLPRFDPLIANLAAVRRRVEAVAAGARRRPLSTVKLLSPVANPGKLFCAPVNYRAHLEEARDDPTIHH